MKHPVHVLDYLNFSLRRPQEFMNRKKDQSPLSLIQKDSSHSMRHSQRFLNLLTVKGKKYQAESVYTQSLKSLSKKLREKQISSSSLQSVTQALENVRPFFEVKKVRVAGSTYQVPALLGPQRSEHKAMNWLKEAAEDRKRKNPALSFGDCFAQEIFDALQTQGIARQKRNELHKLVEANRAFAHFRWW